MGIVAYLLFFVAGVGFGYAAPGRAKLLPLLFPLALFLGAIFREGIAGSVVVKLVVALVVTALGILAGVALDQRGERREAAA